MPIFGERPFTSITVKVNQLCTPNRNADLEDESQELYVHDLISLIKLQGSVGSVETARAIRKKIKYGNTPDELLLALGLLELLILNAGVKIGQPIASDDKLTDLLRSIASGNARSGLGTPYDAAVVRKVRNLAVGWRYELAEMNGFSNFALLWRAVPKKREHAHLRLTSRAEHSPEYVDLDTNGAGHASSEASLVGRKSPPPPRPKTMSPYGEPRRAPKEKKKKKKRSRGGVVYADEEYRIPQINYAKEEKNIRNTIADCYTHTTALGNALLTLPKGTDPLDDKKIASEFERCRKIRRKVLHYLQFVGAGDSLTKSKEIVAMDEEFLGSLIVANDQLVTVFQKFDLACGYTAENPAQYHEDDNRSLSSEESYYSSESSDEEADESLAQRLDSLQVEEASSRLEKIVKAPPPKPKKPVSIAPSSRPEVARQSTGFSVESGDPFGDKNELEGNLSVYY